MEVIKGTKVRAMKIPHGHIVDCRSWLEFAITEHLRGQDKVTYRVPDIDETPQESVCFGSETERAFGQSTTDTGDIPMTPARKSGHPA